MWLCVVLGLDITNNGILLTTNYQGRATGEAFVQFANRDHVEEALKKNKESIGHRLVYFVFKKANHRKFVVQRCPSLLLQTFFIWSSSNSANDSFERN